MANAKEKVRRIMSTFVGGSVSVATIAIATSFQVSLQAIFLDLKVFQNAAYYQIEIVDQIILDESAPSNEEGVPQEPLATRLWVENQWGNFEITLNYGFNEGEISPLRANENYVLSVQYEGDLGWTTLTSETITTAPRLIGNVNTFSIEGSYIDALIDINMNVSTQVGFRPVDQFEVQLIQGNDQWNAWVEPGVTSLTFEDLPHRNVPYDVKILATIQNQTEEIFTQTYFTLPFVDGSYERYFSSLGTLVVVPNRRSSTLVNEKYRYVLTGESYSFSKDWNGNSNLVFENVPMATEVNLTWYVVYNEGVEEKMILISEETLYSIHAPILVLSKVVALDFTTVQLTIDRAYEFSLLDFIQGEKVYSFSLIESNEVAHYYELVVEGVVEGSWELRGWLNDVNPILYTLLVVQL